MNQTSEINVDRMKDKQHNLELMEKINELEDEVDRLKKINFEMNDKIAKRNVEQEK